MSKTIDERIVSMQFDNSRFEKNVSTTMSTLDKLKKSLKFEGATKSLADVNSAVGKVNMSGLGAAVDTVSTKFSALQVMGVTALANITNSAVNAGKRIVKALTIDPITTGFKEYETQINATQTILANTQHKGSTIEDVNKALEELNRYADLTIYNFTEMTRNIGTFTAAGIELDTSVAAIQGIANLAAVSGSTSQQASTAMYQLSQALAAGTVRLMDWNSVVNAGMGGEIFQNALKETSRELETGADAAIEATGSFRESLRQGWLTSEVLTETLKKFTTSGANEYVAKYTGLTVDAVAAEVERAKASGDSATALDRAAEALAKMSGKSKDTIKETLKFAETATDAATKVKTLTQLWEVLKESAQSGWAQTWKIIVGDFEEAKSLLTPFADFLTGILNGLSDWRNAILDSALGRGFGKLSKQLQDVIKPATTALDTVKGAVDTLEDLGKIVDDVILGKFGNGQERIDALTEAGINYYKVQNKVNEKLNNGFRYTEEQIATQDELLGIQKKTAAAAGDQVDALTQLDGAQKKSLIHLCNLTNAQLAAKGMTLEQIAAVNELRETAEKLGMPLEEFINNLDQIDGRWLLIESFKNVGKSIVEVFNSMKEAWQEIFPPRSIEERGEQLFNLIAVLHKFSRSMMISDETADKLKRTFKGVFAIFDMITTVVGGGFKIAFKIVSSILSYFNLNILDVTASIGDAAVKFHDWFESLFDISGLLDAVVPLIESAIEAIKSFASSVKESEAFEVAKNIVDGLINGLTTRTGEVWEAAKEIAMQVLQSIKDFLGIHSPSVEMEEVGKNTVDGFILGIQNGSSGVWECIKGLFGKVVEWIDNLDFGAIVAGLVGIGTVKAAGTAANALDKISSPLDGVGDFLTNTAVMIKKVTKPVKNVIKGVAKIEKAVAFNIATEGIKTLALSLLMLAGAFFIVSQIDSDKLWESVKVVGVLALILVALAGAMKLIGSTSASFNLKDGLNIQGLTLGLVGIGAAILLIAAAAKMMGNLSTEQIQNGFLGIAGIVAAIGAVMLAFYLFSRGFVSVDFAEIGTACLGIAAALLIMATTVKIAGKLQDGEMIQASKFLGGFIVFVGLLATIGALGGKSIDGVGKMMLSLSLALLMMVGVVKLAAGLTEDELIAGGNFLLGFVVFIGILSTIGALGGKAIKGVGTMMLGLSVSLLLMIAVVKLMGEMTPGDLIKGAAVITVFTVIIAQLVKSVMKHGDQAPKVAATILAFSIAIGILAAVAIVCGMISVEGLIKGVAAVTVLSLLMMGLISATRGATNVTSTVIAISATIGVLVAAVALLGMMDPTKLAIGVGAVTILTGMLSLLLLAAGHAKGATGTLIAISAIVVLLGGVLYLLSALPIDSVIGTAASLSVLLLTLAGVLAILTIIGPASSAAYPAMVALAALIGGLMVVLLALGGLSKIPGFNELIADGGATLSLIGQALGAFIGSIVSGFAAAVLTILPMFGLALSAFMVGVTPFIAGVKMIDASVLEGVALLSAAILALTASSVISGMTSLGGLGLIALGLSLSGFMQAAMPFITTAAKIKPEMIEGVKSLAETILILTAAGVLEGIASFVTGGSSLESFAKQLPLLGDGLSQFSTSLGDFSEDQLATVNCAAQAIKTLAQASNEIPNTGGLLGMLVGENELGAFASQFPILGSGLRGFLDNVGEFTDAQVTTVTCAAEAIKTLAQASSEIPNAGGWLGKLVGENDLGTFASQFPSLGIGLRSFLDNVGILDESSSNTVTAAGDAIVALAKAANEIPNSGGWIGKIFGENDIGMFADQFPKLGTGLKGFIDNIGTFSNGEIATISSAIRALNALTNLANADLGNATMYMDSFSNNLPPLADDVSSFCATMPSLSDMTDAVNTIDKLLSAIRNIEDANTGCLSTFASNLKKIGKNAIDKFIEAFTSETAKTDVEDAATKLAEKASDGVESQKESMRTAGNYLGDGLIKGIDEKKSSVYWAGYALGQKAVQGEKDGQQSNSPSKATIQAGKWLGEGLVIGIQRMGDKVYGAGSDIGKTATKSISSAVSKIADAISTDIDAQPTIRPVLDLSDVRSGASAIGGLLGAGAPIGVQANVSAISSMMGSRGQNGINSDVVSAIDKLRKDIGNINTNSYSIGGITVSEGTDAADAIHTLVRVIKMEGRS